MHRTPQPLAAALLAAGIALAAAAGAAPAAPRDAPTQPPTAAAEPQAASTTPQGLLLRDRIVAVVDEDPILASDLDRAIVLGIESPKTGEGDQAFRRRVLDSLIDQRVRYHEVTRFGIEQVPVSQIEQQVETIRARFASEAEFRQQLEDVGLDLESLRQLVTRQLMVWTYFEEFLGPRVFVSLEDIRAYYEQTLTPELEAHGQPVPPIEQVREQIRQVLKEQRLNEAIESKTEELRREADIVNYFENSHESLPPVILEIDGAQAAGKDG